MTPHPPGLRHDQPEGWVECGCGMRHWGRHGAAGLLLADAAGDRVVLQHRAPWSHLGGSWALPGGARHGGEDAVAAALREAAEEAGIEPAAVQVRATRVLRHPDWTYTTVVGRAGHHVTVAAADEESVAVRWVAPDDVTDGRPLLPAFADAWPELRSMLRTDLHVVVDAANVVGSRPDGWWRDRRGAAERLIARLAALDGVPATWLELPGERWWPTWHAVVEGAARGATAVGGIDVVPAERAGDDTIVGTATALADGGATVLVVTADRELTRRCRSAGAQVRRPGGLLTLLDEAPRTLA